MRKVVVIGSIVVVLGAAYYFYMKQIKQLSDMKYQFLKVGLTDFSKEKVDMTISMMVSSDSTLEAQITDLNLDVYIDGVKVGTVNEAKPIIIPAKGSSIVDLKISIPLTGIAMNALDLASQYFMQKDVAVKLNGYGKVKTAFIKTSVPFEYESTLKELVS